MTEYSVATVQASPYSIYTFEPVDIVILWDGGSRDILHNVSLIWASTDGTRLTYRTENGNVRVSNSGAQRHNGKDYRGGYVEALVSRETGSYDVSAK